MIDPATESKIYEMLHSDPNVILMLKYKYTTDNMWKIAIEGEPSLFQHMKEPSEEMVLFALKEDGANIQYLDIMGIEMTPKMMYTAIHNYPGAIFMIPKELRTSHLREYACKEDPSLMKDMPLQQSFIKRQLKKDPSLVRFLSEPTEDQICNAIKSDPTICAYIKRFTPKIKHLIKSIYPDIIPLIPGLSDHIQD